MCAIFGTVNNKSKTILNIMSANLYHRGPDSQDYFRDKFCQFGINRLSIVDINKTFQPYKSQDETIIVVFNGEIYNHKSLRKELEKDGYIFTSNNSDGEVIHNLYIKYGMKFLEKLNGMFAIALYDMNINKLFLIKDRMGKKPLFYTQIKEQFYFASEIKALLKIDNYFEIDKNSLINYLKLKNISAPNTIYKDIKQLSPAHYLEYDIKKQNIKETNYWKLDFSDKLAISEDEISKELISLIEDSTKIRTKCDVEYGAYLSGGLDSSLITSILANNHNQGLKTFSLGYKDDFKNKQNDLYYAKKLSSKLGTDHYEYILDSKEVFDEISDVLKAFDEPFSGTISTYFLTKLISRYVKVALSGDGADELFGSYLTHRISIPIETYLQTNMIKSNTLSNQEKELIQRISNKNIKHWRNQLNVFNDDDLKQLFEDNVDILNPYQNIELSSRDMLDKCLEIDQKELLPNHILPFVDRLSMAHSVEVRNPFLDYKVVEYASKIPSNLKIKDGVNKYILKKSSIKYLANEIIKRPKEGFVLPVYQWIENEYFDIVRDTVLNSAMIDDFIFNKKYIENLFYLFKIEKKQHAKIWNLYSLAIWYEGIK